MCRRVTRRTRRFTSTAVGFAPNAMITHEEARQIAHALPEAVEQDHHGRPRKGTAPKRLVAQRAEASSAGRSRRQTSS